MQIRVTGPKIAEDGTCEGYDYEDKHQWLPIAQMAMDEAKILARDERRVKFESPHLFTPPSMRQDLNMIEIRALRMGIGMIDGRRCFAVSRRNNMDLYLMSGFRTSLISYRLEEFAGVTRVT